MSAFLENSGHRAGRRAGERDRPVRVSDVSQLRQVATWREVLTGSPGIILGLPGMDAEESRRWQSVINTQLSACGCTEGAVFLIAGVLGYIAFLVLFRAEEPWLGWSTVGVGIAIAAGASLTGKLAGLIRARVRLARAIRHLEVVTGAVPSAPGAAGVRVL